MCDKAIGERLNRPFGPEDLEWKVQQSGLSNRDGSFEPWALVIPYISARAAAKRLDEVFGLDGWDVTYRPITLGEQPVRDRQGAEVGLRVLTGVVATLTVRLGDKVIVREDGAEPTAVEPVKGGISSAFKRVCVTLGVGRYLYETDPIFAVISERGTHRGSARDQNGKRHPFRWDPPREALERLTAGHGAPPAPPIKPATRPAKAAPAQQAPAADAEGVVCPTCQSPNMQDQRATKKNPRAPDFVCRERGCKGVIWPERAKSPARATAPAAAAHDDDPGPDDPWA